MAQQISAGRTFMGRRGFSSASAVCGLGGNRTYVASIRPPIGNACGVPHFTSQSLSNMGGTRRISYGGYGGGYHGGYSYGHGGYNNLGFGGRVGHIGPNVYEGTCGPMRGYGNSRNDGIQGVRINEKLLKPLRVGVDPHDQEVRNHEREEMKNLNNQFACFIDKVRYLEQQNKVLETKWNLLQECAIPPRRNIEPLYENFISNMKRQLECLSADREKLASEHAAIQHVVEEFKCKYEDEVKRRASAENEFVLLKKDVDCLAMSKAELEGKLDLVVRELEFRRCVYPEELAHLDGHVCDMSILLQMDNSRNLDIDYIIRNVEAWYLSVAQRSKEEVNALYENRFQELQVQRGKYTNDLKINQHEIADLSRLVQKLQSEHDAVKKQVDHLQTTICDVEQKGDCALKDARDKHVELHTALHKAKDDLAGMLRDYHELLNTKLALDIEIATYRTLLEGEESRICTGNLVMIDVVKPPFIGGTAAFPAAHGYPPKVGGYGESHGRDSRNFSSRSVGHGQPSRARASTATPAHSSTDAEFFSETRQGSRNVSYSVGKKTTEDIDSSSTAGVSVNCAAGRGFSSGNKQGSAVNTGKGHTTSSVTEGGYLSGSCAPLGAIPFGSFSGGFGPKIVGGPVAMGCNPGCLGGGSIGVPAVGIPAVGVPTMRVPSVGVSAMGVPCIPAVGVGAHVGMCYPGAVGVPVNVCYPGAVGLVGNAVI